ncbi:thioesterase family protein [Calderihabitans maritimus]|uniref:Fluoroacetyl-CoA-specific thioesterase-like domain-containing protein n=1 Tax=Calderihabitans maritimus TaxID=1246530 RepID=A0A1Z5HRR6_9FIRM|nr:thioesterase family protein [Calderihabitans maritimus]GAW92223.1 hypothetical protein HM1_0673 [Calderihabitans maritimus]
MSENLKVGLKGEAKEVVTSNNTAIKYGSGSVEVYATPAMIGLMEKAALSSVDPLLPEGQTTVGTALNVRHLAATPIGLTVTARSELIQIENRKLVFRVEAFDSKEKIGEGTHERFIVDLERFLSRADKKVKG